MIVLSNINNNVNAVSQRKVYNNGEIETYAEEVSWYSRYVNGKEQRRLWSHTYGRWITDWIWA